MIAVIKGDIIQSRQVNNPEKWLEPLKTLLSKWGSRPQQWELVWGDFFQLELEDPSEVLKVALEIKALIRSISPEKANQKTSTIDVRMAIGIGSRQFQGQRISESSGEAFIYSGECFDVLRKERVTLAVRSQWSEFDRDANLLLKLAALQMDTWSLTSAELMRIVLPDPNKTQTEIGEMLGIGQNAVSGRWSRACADEILEVEQWFREKIRKQLKC